MVDYPIGYRSFHRDVALNYQLNRWLPVMEEAEVTTLAGEVSSAADFSRAMRTLAERTAAARGRRRTSCAGCAP